DVTAVIRTLQRAGRQDGGEVEIIVAEATGEDSAEATLLQAHWPAARRVLLGDRGSTAAPVGSPPPSAFPSTMAETLVTDVSAPVEEYRRHRWSDLNGALGRTELPRRPAPRR